MRAAHALFLPVLCLALAVLAPCAAAQSSAEPDAIAALYDGGNYEAARALIERLDEAGAADGVMLYRLAFCQLRAGDEQAARGTMERALVDLEGRSASASAVIVPFYLANTYQNLGRASDVVRIAERTVGRVERGELVTGSAVDEFRVAKLYADLGRRPQAVEWYSRALESFSKSPTPHAAYVSWARSYLASATAPAAAPSRPAPGATDAVRADAEAVEHARAGRYAEAADAWRRAGGLRPVDPNRPRYCARLAETAASLGELPAAAPDGRAWSELDRSALQATLLEQTALLRGVRKLAAAIDRLPSRTDDGTRWSRLGEAELRAALAAWGSGEDVPPQVDTGRKPMRAKQRAALRARLEGELRVIRPTFTAAGLWFGIGGHGLRETAFFGGFAPLIFRDQEWSLD